MGQDVIGLSPSSVKVMPSGASHDTIDGIYTKSSVESSEPKDALAKEDVIDGAPEESSNAMDGIAGVKSSNLGDAKHDVKSPKVEEPKPGVPVEDAETKHIVQNLCNATADQHACATPISAELKHKPPRLNNLHSPSSSKKSQSNKHLDDEDDWSTASSTTASVRTERTKTTMPLAPKFTVTERLEKRKEFYSKVEEKRKALEAEKREYEARNKEEQQAAIKQLRKTMTYKANPVPNFYYEGPPPKKEMKKLPTTRAVSPKLGRRKSCGDAMSSLPEEKVVSVRAPRHSMGARDLNLKHASRTPTNTPKKKGVVHEQSSKSSLKKERPKQVAKESSLTKQPTPDAAADTALPPDTAAAPEPQSSSQEIAHAPAQAVPLQDITEPKMANLSIQS